MKLDEQKCAACVAGSARLSDEDSHKLLDQTPGWRMTGNAIEREYRFPNFVEAMKFANRITEIAEAENHHPDLHVSWGKVGVELSTHSVGGLSLNDFIVAAKINRVWDAEEHQQAI